ncbi:MAG: hypothetical protein AB7N61_25160 [Acidimicrobiia bacterium]
MSIAVVLTVSIASAAIAAGFATSRNRPFDTLRARINRARRDRSS